MVSFPLAPERGARLLLQAHRNVAMLRVTAQRDNSPLHKASDRHIKPLTSVISAAFDKGRKAYKAGGVKSAQGAIRAALLDTLEPALLAVLEDCGNVALWMLPKRRAAGDVEGHPFHGNQWTATSGERTESEAKAALSSLPRAKGSHSDVMIGNRMSPEYQKSFNEALAKASAIGMSIDKDGKSIQLTPKDIANVQVTQTGVDKGKVVDLIGEHHDWINGPREGSVLRPIVVVRHEGKNVVIDGHHRLVAAGLLGKSVIVRLLDLDKKHYTSLESRTLAGPLHFKFDPSNPNAAKWAREHATELANDLSDTSRDAIKAAVAREQETGEDAYDEILDAVGNEARAEMIARTEAMDAANEGLAQGWSQAVDEGLLTGDEQKEWIATPGCCDECDAVDGEKVPMDEDFSVGDDPPLHPNCRCTMGLVS